MKFSSSLMLKSIFAGLIILVLGWYFALLPLFTDIKSLTLQNEILQQAKIKPQQEATQGKGEGLNSQEVYQWFHRAQFSALRLDDLSKQDSVLQLQLRGPKNEMINAMSALQYSPFRQLHLSDVETSDVKATIDFTAVYADALIATPPPVAVQKVIVPLPVAEKRKQALGLISKNNICYAIENKGGKITLRKMPRC